jgi:XTP/dITP diphosphohydrolase
MEKIVIASNNAGKLREFNALFTQFGINAITQGELGITEAEEPYATFVENALTKARHAARLSKLPALADDSGICVASLGGAPGVWSARYASMQAGEPKSDTRNNEKLLADMQGVVNRDAFFYCVLVFVRTADDPQPIIADGVWHGEITHAPRGTGGFGYNPVFNIPALSLTAAEISDAQKNALSHRAQALRVLMEKLAQFGLVAHGG